MKFEIIDSHCAIWRIQVKCNPLLIEFEISLKYDFILFARFSHLKNLQMSLMDVDSLIADFYEI